VELIVVPYIIHAEEEAKVEALAAVVSFESFGQDLLDNFLQLMLVLNSP
jgi:hypothetical protein